MSQTQVTNIGQALFSLTVIFLVFGFFQSKLFFLASAAAFIVGVTYDYQKTKSRHLNFEDPGELHLEKRELRRFLENSVFQNMADNVSEIIYSIYSMLQTELEKRFTEEDSRLLAAAASNKIFGYPRSPLHSRFPKELIYKIAEDVIETDEDPDVLLGIVLALRTSLVLANREEDSRRVKQVLRAIGWIKQRVPLPSDSPTPTSVRELTSRLKEKYQPSQSTKGEKDEGLEISDTASVNDECRRSVSELSTEEAFVEAFQQEELGFAVRTDDDLSLLKPNLSGSAS